MLSPNSVYKLFNFLCKFKELSWNENDFNWISYLSAIFASSWQTGRFLLMTPTQGPPRTPLSNIGWTPQPNAWSTSTCSRPQKSHSEDPLWMFASLNASLPRRHPDTCSPRLCQCLLRVAPRPSTGDPPGVGRALCHLICWMNSAWCWARLAAAPRVTTDRKWSQGKEGYRKRSVWTGKQPLQGRVEKERCGGWQTETTQCRWSQRRCFHDLSLRTALNVGYRKRCRCTRGCGKQVQGRPWRSCRPQLDVALTQALQDLIYMPLF